MSRISVSSLIIECIIVSSLSEETVIYLSKVRSIFIRIQIIQVSICLKFFIVNWNNVKFSLYFCCVEISGTNYAK
ncbi:unnamed protein product [Schistosoma margrebowiei]|uniref:Uncharacterized protein n=1 Tax=Schistosoma margrebowiei TaxID=48269 RepID=A0AA84ZUV5_9TREM|nr:unnamed protein product [Schistosoma margrebowiei]